MSQAWIEGLPFLAGTAALIERIAHRHHDLSHDTVVLAFDPGAAAGPSWKELMAGAYGALRSVGIEVAEAKTTDEVAAAKLRQETYLEGITKIEETILQIAQRKLSNKPLPDLEEERWIGYASFGRRVIGGCFELIPIAHWEAGTMDWLRRQLTLGDGTTWTGIRILDLSDLALDQADALVGDLLGIERDGEQAKSLTGKG